MSFAQGRARTRVGLLQSLRFAVLEMPFAKAQLGRKGDN
jgi:hypothetical protein